MGTPDFEEGESQAGREREREEDRERKQNGVRGRDLEEDDPVHKGAMCQKLQKATALNKDLEVKFKGSSLVPPLSNSTAVDLVQLKYLTWLIQS